METLGGGWEKVVDFQASTTVPVCPYTLSAHSFNASFLCSNSGEVIDLNFLSQFFDMGSIASWNLLAIPVWSSAVSVTFSTTSLIETVTIGVNWLVAAAVVGASAFCQAGGQVINGLAMLASKWAVSTSVGDEICLLQ